MNKPPVLILHASGTNRDHDAAFAFALAGGEPEIVHVNQLRSGERRLPDYRVLVLPGGFSYADALGAGRLLALDLRAFFADEVQAFVAAGRPVIGICNGFQALVKSGILPGPDQQATLTHNGDGHFECRWVTLRPDPTGPCIWTRDLAEPIYCPVAHGEGRFVPRDEATLAALQVNRQIALAYACAEGAPAEGAYPLNPNGSIADIAGVCNPAGNVLGLMPHPEDHVVAAQHPRHTRGERAGLGLRLFVNGVAYAAQL
jgi:phosphoribosylformylglycinamidine synthase I